MFDLRTIQMFVFSAYEGVLYAMVLHLFLGFTLKQPLRFIFHALISVVLIIGSALMVMPFPIKSLVVLVILTIIAKIIYPAPAHVILFVTVTTFYLNLVADLVVGNIVSGIYTESIIVLFGENVALTNISGICVRIIQLCFAVLLVHYFKRVIFDNPRKYWYLLDAILVLSYTLAALFLDINPILQTNRTGFFVVGAIFAFVLINVLAIVMFSQMSKQHRFEKQSVLHEAMAERTLREMKETQAKEEQFRRIAHEWKNYNASLQLSLRLGQVGDALSLIESTGVLVPDIKTLNYTENEGIDYVLAGKVEEAERFCIDVELHCLQVGQVSVSQNDLISVISNLFDNAIEAVMPLEPPLRRIVVVCKRSSDYLLFNIENPYRNTIVTEGGAIVTSKEDAAKHGFGLEISRTICKKYHGALLLTHDDGIFIARASFRIS